MFRRAPDLRERRPRARDTMRPRALVPRPAEQRVADGVRRRRSTSRRRRGSRCRGRCSCRAESNAVAAAPRRRQLGAARARVRNVVGAPAARRRENVRPTEMIRSVVAVEERRGVDLHRAARERLRHAEFDAAAALRLQPRVVGEGDLERIGRTDAGAERAQREARAFAGDGTSAAIFGFTELIVSLGKVRPRLERRADRRATRRGDGLAAHAGRDGRAIGRVPARLAEEASTLRSIGFPPSGRR